MSAHLDGRPSPMIEHYQQSTTTIHKVGDSQKTRALRITAVVRPTPDVHSLAKALVQLARDEWDRAHPDVHLDEKIEIDLYDDIWG